MAGRTNSTKRVLTEGEVIDKIQSADNQVFLCSSDKKLIDRVRKALEEQEFEIVETSSENVPPNAVLFLDRADWERFSSENKFPIPAMLELFSSKLQLNWNGLGLVSTAFNAREIFVYSEARDTGKMARISGIVGENNGFPVLEPTPDMTSVILIDGVFRGRQTVLRLLGMLAGKESGIWTGKAFERWTPGSLPTYAKPLTGFQIFCGRLQEDVKSLITVVGAVQVSHASDDVIVIEDGQLEDDERLMLMNSTPIVLPISWLSNAVNNIPATTGIRNRISPPEPEKVDQLSNYNVSVGVESQIIRDNVVQLVEGLQGRISPSATARSDILISDIFVDQSPKSNERTLVFLLNKKEKKEIWPMRFEKPTKLDVNLKHIFDNKVFLVLQNPNLYSIMLGYRQALGGNWYDDASALAVHTDRKVYFIIDENTRNREELKGIATRGAHLVPDIEIFKSFDGKTSPSLPDDSLDSFSSSDEESSDSSSNEEIRDVLNSSTKCRTGRVANFGPPPTFQSGHGESSRGAPRSSMSSTQAKENLVTALLTPGVMAASFGSGSESKLADPSNYEKKVDVSQQRKLENKSGALASGNKANQSEKDPSLLVPISFSTEKVTLSRKTTPSTIAKGSSLSATTPAKKDTQTASIDRSNMTKLSSLKSKLSGAAGPSVTKSSSGTVPPVVDITSSSSASSDDDVFEKKPMKVSRLLFKPTGKSSMDATLQTKLSKEGIAKPCVKSSKRKENPTRMGPMPTLPSSLAYAAFSQNTIAEIDKKIWARSMDANKRKTEPPASNVQKKRSKLTASSVTKKKSSPSGAGSDKGKVGPKIPAQKKVSVSRSPSSTIEIVTPESTGSENSETKRPSTRSTTIQSLPLTEKFIQREKWFQIADELQQQIGEILELNHVLPARDLKLTLGPSGYIDPRYGRFAKSLTDGSLIIGHFPLRGLNVLGTRNESSFNFMERLTVATSNLFERIGIPNVIVQRAAALDDLDIVTSNGKNELIILASFYTSGGFRLKPNIKFHDRIIDLIMEMRLKPLMVYKPHILVTCSQEACVCDKERIKVPGLLIWYEHEKELARKMSPWLIAQYVTEHKIALTSPVGSLKDKIFERDGAGDLEKELIDMLSRFARQYNEEVKKQISLPLFCNECVGSAISKSKFQVVSKDRKCQICGKNATLLVLKDP